MLAPTISRSSEKRSSMYFPKREELSFRVVFAFPIASITGFEASTFFSIWVMFAAPPTEAKYRIANLAETVLPAPDSPDTIIDWFLFSLNRQRYASSAMANTCGSSAASFSADEYRSITYTASLTGSMSELQRCQTCWPHNVPLENREEGERRG